MLYLKSELGLGRARAGVEHALYPWCWRRGLRTFEAERSLTPSSASSRGLRAPYGNPVLRPLRASPRGLTEDYREAPVTPSTARSRGLTTFQPERSLTPFSKTKGKARALPLS